MNPFSSIRAAGVEFKRTKVAVGGRILEIQHLRDIDPLLERMDEEARRDEKIPYFGELWPASIGLARWLGRNVGMAGRRVLEIGCGVGVTGIAAGLRGAHVTFADYFREALDLVEWNARKNGLQELTTLLLDWRDESFQESFDLVLGADVIYEERNHRPLIDLTRRCLSPGGRAYFADPGRVNLEEFGLVAKATGFVLARHHIVIQEGGERVDRIHVLELALPS